MASSKKLITLVTGANQGIGFYVAKQLSATGQHYVLLGSRDISKSKQAIEAMRSDTYGPSDTSNMEAIQIDVTSDASISAAAEQIREKFGRLDVLMNNAGISKAAGMTSDIETKSGGPCLREQFAQQYDTNVFGAAVVTETFLPLLRQSEKPRVSFTSSSLGSHAISSEVEKGEEGWAGNYRIYRSTKAALNMLLISYARQLEHEGFVVSAACPGFCGTNLNGYRGFRHPSQGALAVVRTVTGAKEEVHAKVINDSGIVPW